MTNLTELEAKTFNAIKNNADEQMMECVDIKDLVNITGEDAKKLRGAISSLVKKEMVEVEEFDGNDTEQQFYWPV